MDLVEIATFSEDVAGMRAFYERLLGAKPVAASSSMAIFMVGHTKIFMHQSYEASEGELPPENHLAFSVEDVDAACAELARSGTEIEVAPKDYYWGRSAYLRDPGGQLIELLQGEDGE